MMKFISKAIVLLFALISGTALAQNYPSGKPVRILIGFGAGGVTDAILRLAAEDFSKRIGGSFIVENRPGAGGLIAAQAVKNSPADGYTLYGGSATPFNALFLKDNPMDAAKELQPVSIIAIGDNFLMVRADLATNNYREFVTKAKTTRLKHSSPATTQHALMSLWAKAAGFEYDNIPYKTSDQAVQALLSGDGDFVLTSLAGWIPHINAGKIRVIGVLAPTRSALNPSVPTAKELGANVEFRFNLGLWAPLGTPRDIVNKLSAATIEAVKTPAMAEKINFISMIPAGSSPEELLKTFQAEIKAYQEATTLIGMQPQ